MITPKPFQQKYIANVLELFGAAKSLYDEVGSDFERRRVFAYNGACLLKAPTGAGKTLIAGTVAEELSQEDKLVWLWFAPFKGLVGQAAMSLRDHHPGLRVRDLSSDRRAAGTRSGDTFVLTWASVVARSADARKIRTDNEQLASLDDFLADLREEGFHIGVIIDEAHHGIGAKTQSVEFFRDVLRPDYTLMVTATPDDADAERFMKAAAIKDLHRVQIPREEAVEAGLVKEGVRSIAYISPPDQAVLADFEAAALQDACTMHARIKQELAAEKINQLKSQLTKTSPFVMIAKVGGKPNLQLVSNNQPTLFPAPPSESESTEYDSPEEEATSESPGDSKARSQALLDLLGAMAAKVRGGSVPSEEASPDVHRYHLKAGMPLRFLTQELPVDILEHLLSCMEQQVAFDNRALLTALAKDVQIIRIDKLHFANAREEERSYIHARIDLEKAERQAQKMLMRQTYLSPKELQDHLLKRLAEEFVNHGLSEVAQDEERLEAALSLILVRYPGLLKEVEKTCAAKFSFTREAEPLPGFVDSVEPLSPSFRNIYGVFPSDLNEWEVEFAKLLDNDTSGAVLWWHRNPVKKKHSVAIVRPDGGRFFPDFVVGVKGRTLGKDGVLLIETKHAIGSVDSKIKAVIEHKDYGRALMIHWKDWHESNKRTAMTVIYDPATDQNLLDAVFRCKAMPSY